MLGAALFLFVRATGKEGEKEGEEKMSVGERFREMKELIVEPGAWKILVYYTFAGVAVGCYAGFIYKLVDRSYKRSDGESEE